MSCDNNDHSFDTKVEGYPWMTDEDYLGSDIPAELPISLYEFVDGCIILVGLGEECTGDLEPRFMTEDGWDGSVSLFSEDGLDDIPF